MLTLLVAVQLPLGPLGLALYGALHASLALHSDTKVPRAASACWLELYSRLVEPLKSFPFTICPFWKPESAGIVT